MSAELPLPWTEANQACLVAEFARLKARLESGPSEAAAAEEARSALEPPAAIDRLTELFGLSEFERDLLLLCAGLEMDSKLGDRCGELLGSPSRRRATFGLAMSRLNGAHWSAFTPAAPLRHFHLVELERGAGLASAPLSIDERVLHYLAGINEPDVQLGPWLRPGFSGEWIADDHRLLAAQAARALGVGQGELPLLHLCGNDPQGQEDVAALAAQSGGRRLLVLEASELPAVGPELEALLRLWQREALLLPGALLIRMSRGEFSPAAAHVAERAAGWVFLASREAVHLSRAFLRLEVDKPGPGGQKRLWQKALGEDAAGLNGALDHLAEQFSLSARTVLTAAASAGSDADALWNTCRAQARPKLEDLAQRIVPAAQWADLVLPAAQLGVLRQLASQVRNRMTVHETWGFAGQGGGRGLGVSALFTGDSGAGKTLAAEVLARELKLDLYRIDLAAVVSKYIGETEKNLKRVFDAAEEGGALLLFDEADALFGKRGEVSDSRDRYANIEVGYLLQRMEAYRGLAILTTNLKNSLDRAFQRRLRFTVDFPFPDATQREAIWQRIFPAQTPTQGLDAKRLAQLNVAGGNIRNIALNAAFLAAENAQPVAMAHVLQAARQEAQKTERPLTGTETKGWV